MKTCMNISVTIWPMTPVAPATRHSRLSQGCEFSLSLSTSYKGQAPETNLDNPEVSRSEEHTSELQSQLHLVCHLLLEKKKMLTQTQMDGKYCTLVQLEGNAGRTRA